MSQTDTTDRVAELHATLERQVAELVAGEDWTRMLQTASRFHRYSWRNTMLIFAQRPDATRVAGYKTWQAMGRQVLKGEKGIAILAPVGGPCKPCGGTGHHPADPTLTCGRCFGRGRWANFKPTHVFDESQTDGEPIVDVRPTLLAGEAPAGLWDGLAAQVEAAGFSLARGDCNGANGVTIWGSREVRVRADVDDAQAAKTLAHELAHVLLHETDRNCRGRVEVEAESVAYIVAAASGLATDGYSLPYVASWADGDSKVVAKTAERVTACARSILEQLEGAEDVEAVAA